MIDIAKHVENMVRDHLAQACRAQGVDKSEVGYAVGGGGAICPQVVRNPDTGESGIVGFAPTWQITVSIRSKLIGQEPIAGSIPIHDVLPTQAQIEPLITRLLSEVVQIREQQFSGGMPQAGPSMPLNGSHG